MNLKEPYKAWRDTCPEEANGLVSKKQRKIFNKILERSANKKRLAELNKQEKEQK